VVAITATKAEDGSWSSAPEEMEPDRIDTLVEELARLRARDILADAMGPEELRGLALEPPKTKLVVHGADEGAPLADLRLGVVRDGGGIVAQALGNPTVFELDPAVSQFVPVSLDDFRAHFVAKPEDAGDAADAAQGGDATTPASPEPGS
jgi:hypothetical protein